VAGNGGADVPSLGSPVRGRGMRGWLIGGLASLRANRFRWMRRWGLRRSAGRGFRPSRRSIFTSTWFAITDSGGATRGGRRSCNPRGFWRGQSGVELTAASNHAGRLPGMMLHQSLPREGGGRFAARLARGPAGNRSDRYLGRCNERDLFGLSGA
jgi:hypothetical protein